MKKLIKILPILLILSKGLFAQDTIWTQKSGVSSLSAYSVAISDDGSKAFSGSECHPASLRMFDAANGSLLWNYELTGSLMCVSSVKFSSSAKLLAGLEEFGNLLIFDYSGATPVLSKTLTTTPTGAFALDFSDDGKKVAIGCINSKLIIIDIGSGAELHNVVAHGTWVQGVDWQKDKIATGGSDNVVKLWDSAGNFIRSYTGHSAAVLSVQFSKDGQYILSSSADKTIKLWNVATGALIRTFSGHKAQVMQAVLSDDGAKIVSGSKDSTIKVWESTTGTNLFTFSRKNSGWVNSVSFSPNGKQILAGTANGDVQMWDLSKTNSVKDFFIKSPECILYPNPAQNQLWLKYAPSQIKQLNVTNVTGIVQEIPNLYGTNNILLDISQLSNGQYFVTIHTKEGAIIRESFIKSN